MIKHIQARDLLKSDEVVREPIEEVNNKLINSNSKRIIVTGGRGTGKSVVLYNNELKQLGNSKQTIFMNFDAIITFPNEYTDFFNEKLINQYYEIQFCYKLLNYIKRNYPLIYQNYFKFYERSLRDVTCKTNDYINNCVYKKMHFDNYIKPTDLSESILMNLKSYLKIDNITLAIDRFDWTNGSYANIQNILTKFFDMFDKVIVTTDDESLQNLNNRESLINKGYSFIDVDYSNWELIIQDIIKKRIKKRNENRTQNDIIFPEDIITIKIYKDLVSKTNGNINCMFECINGVISDWEWKKGKIDIEKSFDKNINYQLTKVKELKAMDANPPKLHL